VSVVEEEIGIESVCKFFNKAKASGLMVTDV
jgi:hypothetical protein